MSGIDAIIFDLGNVLIHVDEATGAARMAARTGRTREDIETYYKSTPYATALALGKLARGGFYRKVAQDLGFDGSYEEFANIWSEIFTPIEPMITLAESLKTRLRRVLLSNTNAIHMEYILQRFPFLSDFDARVLSYEVGMLKPDAAIYRHTLRNCGLAAGRTVLVDDSLPNVRAAQSVGMLAVHHQTPEQTRQELTKLGVAPI